MKLYNKKDLSRDIIFLVILGVIILFLKSIGIGWFCPFYDGIGIPCPGCGFSSAVLALFRLDFTAAFWHHPLVYFSPLIAAYYFYANYFVKNKPKNYELIIKIIIVIFFVVYLLRLFSLIPNSSPLTFNNDSLLVNLLSVLF